MQFAAASVYIKQKQQQAQFSQSDSRWSGRNPHESEITKTVVKV